MHVIAPLMSVDKIAYVHTVDVEKTFAKYFSEHHFNKCSIDKQT